MGDRDVGHGGRGHLDPDDLGVVERGAVDLDAPEPSEGYEVLTGPDRPTWDERLEAVGVTPFLRAHPLLVRSVLAVGALMALALGGLAGYASAMPPADDGVVAADVWEYSAGTTVTMAGGPGSVLQVAYTIIPRRNGDRLRLLGLDGPGVRATSGVQAPRPGAAGSDVYGLAAVIPECDDPEIGTAVEADYHLRLERTDPFGRRVTGLVDLPATTASQWARDIVRLCRQRWFDERITTAGVDVGTEVSSAGSARLVLGIHLRNGMSDTLVAFLAANQDDRYLQALSTGWTTPPSTGMPNEGELPGGRTTTLVIRRPVADCRTAASPESGLLGAPYLLGYVRAERVPGTSSELAVGRIRVSWSASDRTRVLAALRELCAGMPSAEVGVVSATTATDDALSATFAEIDGLPAEIVRVRLHVQTAAARVRASAVDPLFFSDYPDPVEMTTAISTVRHGTTDVDVLWAARCTSVQAPPTVALVLWSNGRAYPTQVVLDDRVLAAAYLRTCPNLSPGTLAQSGWSRSE